MMHGGGNRWRWRREWRREIRGTWYVRWRRNWEPMWWWWEAMDMDSSKGLSLGVSATTVLTTSNALFLLSRCLLKLLPTLNSLFSFLSGLQFSCSHVCSLFSVYFPVFNVKSLLLVAVSCAVTHLVCFVFVTLVKAVIVPCSPDYQLYFQGRHVVDIDNLGYPSPLSA